MKKTLKFRHVLADLILTGQKDVTWRLFDDKNLRVGDDLDLIEWETGNKFASAKIIDLYEKTMGKIDSSDFDGHEKFASKDEMYKTYSRYYNTTVDAETLVKVIKLELSK